MVGADGISENGELDYKMTGFVNMVLRALNLGACSVPTFAFAAIGTSTTTQGVYKQEIWLGPKLPVAVRLRRYRNG